jgi:hypothetical protein
MPKPQQCPECKNPMRWQEGLLVEGARDLTIGRYYCLACNLFCGGKESKAIIKGKRLANELVGEHALSKKITSHSTAEQIGILRARQHCATCGKPNYPQNKPEDYCRCKNCKCLYCRVYKIGGE